MKKRFASFERGLLLMLFAHPALLWLCDFVFPMQPGVTALCELGCLIAGLALSQLRVKRRVRLSALVMLAQAALIAALPLPCPGKLALLAFLPLTDWLCRNAMARVLDARCLPFVICGYALYAVCAMLARGDFYPEHLRQACLAGALAYLPVSLVLLNACVLRNVSLMRLDVAATMRIAAGNRALTYGFGLMVTLAVYSRQIRGALDRVGDALLALVRRVAAFVLNLLMQLMSVSEEPTSMGAGGEQGMMLAERTETSVLVQMLEKIMFAVVGVVAAALVGFGIWQLGRRLGRRLRKWWNALRNKWASGDAGYEDEIVTTLRFGEASEHRRARMKRKRKRPDWRTLSPEDRVRYVAESLMERKTRAPSDTPRALLSDDQPELVQGYEVARYSSLPVSEKQAELAETLYKCL